MDSSSAAAEMVTLCAAAGSVVHYFPRPGQRHRNPILPVIKLSGNPLTVATMSEHIDVDLTACCASRSTSTRPRQGMQVLEHTINGRFTR